MKFKRFLEQFHLYEHGAKQKSTQSFVWDYFRKEGMTSMCGIILDDKEEFDASYNDGSI
ncbi:25210_t:CDS:2 [Gigaspora margarita]|uniref:25210_t:CDS:1 n=1 Tax=Gigaspora margarita TaxID=4874 RepID=A0ABN7VQM9_GIGMA|nr:25210_t:CDS:2 [Gigaspora margarita]